MRRRIRLFLLCSARCFTAPAAVSGEPITSMANVTRKNFKESLQQLTVHIQTADFIALDLEMTGVQSAPWRRSMELDTVETRYQNLRDSAEKFAVFQCGICPFRWDLADRKFIAYPYNFYLFPRNELPFDTASRDFLCQTSSLEFLAKHQFDFNACIYDGISYLSKWQEDIARVRLGLAGERASNTEEGDSEIPLTRTSDVIFSERVRIEVGQWRDKVLRNRAQLCDLKSTVDNDEHGMRQSLIIRVMDDRQAKIAQQVLRRSFQDLVSMVEEAADDSRIPVVKVLYTSSKEDKATLIAEVERGKTARMEALLREAVGFRHVIDLIGASGKLVVGHNCILDFVHIYSKFFGALPSSSSEFCACVRQHFPCIVDTKYMLKADALRNQVVGTSTSLDVVYAQFFPSSEIATVKDTRKNKHSVKVKVAVAPEFERYGETTFKHEAGYDAYMTGAVFAHLCQMLHVDLNTIQSLPEQLQLGQSVLSRYANLLYFGWIGHFVLDLKTGKQATGSKALREQLIRAGSRPTHDTALLLWGQSSIGNVRTLKRQVMSCFEGTKYSANLSVIPVDDFSAFLIFKSLESMEVFFSSFDGNNGSLQSSSVSKLAANGLRVARFETFEKLCQSPISTEKLSDSIEMFKRCCVDFGDNKQVTQSFSIPESAKIPVEISITENDEQSSPDEVEQLDSDSESEGSPTVEVNGAGDSITEDFLENKGRQKQKRSIVPSGESDQIDAKRLHTLNSLHGKNSQLECDTVDTI